MSDRSWLGSSWRPYTLRWHFLLILIGISLLLIIAIQLLLSKSRREQGLIFTASVANLPLSSTFQYLHLPTIVFAIYGLIWTWVDLDVRRLEPFHQLSKPEGGKGSDTMLLHYSDDFIASVPIKAARFG
jgi:hypothetical protein